ncbi:AT-rich interactive domain-containing protein 1B-like, partial [Selaginella moellendorffii]|uniref:AT-rich interactive domain-containing protein 1B-like n=1 Tax=Selaginella moellendorffii TaxID=88036 RepID=UPI000D1C63D5
IPCDGPTSLARQRNRTAGREEAVLAERAKLAREIVYAFRSAQEKNPAAVAPAVVESRTGSSTTTRDLIGASSSGGGSSTPPWIVPSSRDWLLDPGGPGEHDHHGGVIQSAASGAGGSDGWGRAVGYGFVGSHPSPGDGGLGPGGGGGGGGGDSGGGASGLGLAPHHHLHLRDILGRGPASEEFGYHQQHQQHQRASLRGSSEHAHHHHHHPGEQGGDQGGQGSRVASFEAYETTRNVGGIGLLRTGLEAAAAAAAGGAPDPKSLADHPHHHHHHHHAPWASAPPPSVRELSGARGIDVVPLAERFSLEAAAAAAQEKNPHPLQLVQIQGGAQQQAQQNPITSVALIQSQNPSPSQQQQQGTDSSSSRPHGRGHQPGGATCKECGNQAKKDCQFQRCRTCCKSRNYDCSTHVKSTWVPAAKRRERQALEAAAIAAGQPRPRSKRTRSLALGGGSSSAAAQVGGGMTANPSSLLGLPGPSSPRSSADLPVFLPLYTAASSYRGVLPPEVRAQALFKCVKVTGIEDGENEYAYQATVKIGGHVFKGVLYDQGVEAPSAAAAAPAAAAPGGVAHQAAPIAGLADLQLGASRSSMPSSSGYLDPSQIYGSTTLFGALR